MTRESTWYKDAIIYEVHVRAFYDASGDGVGDFKGLIERLDYVAELGVSAIWLLPFYPSPGRDDGYDVADYTGVHPSYGTLRDVRRLVKEAHRRNLRVITELVCNHTSDQHPWFQRARKAPRGSSARDFYVWSDSSDRYAQARIIFKDFETSNWAWDPVAQQHFWHRFYSHQPDLNFDNPRVEEAIHKVVDFWLGMGIDGLRLDAIPYLYEREGTNCENLPESHAFLRRLRAHVDANFPNRMLLAEANQWPEDAVAYFGDGDECHMAFHFPVMPRLFMAVQMEDRFPIIDILAQTPPSPESAQWALFLRNHDELTLEMVTDEERDYMYRVYTRENQARINLGIRRRLAPLLQNNRRRIELMNGLLFSLPGTPVLYYGDEIGMGDNIYLGDRNGVRTPMQWSADRNAGFSTANRQKLYLPPIVDPEYHYEAVNVEAQQGNPQSLLNWMKRLIALRKEHPAFGRGSLEFLHPENRKVLAFVRRYEGETILVVANLSRFAQHGAIDLSGFRGLQPVEMFGRTEFAPIGDQPYYFMLGPHNFYWLSLEPQRVSGPQDVVPVADTPVLVSSDGLKELVMGRDTGQLTEVLPSFLRDQRWFGSKARRIKAVSVSDHVHVPHGAGASEVAILEVQYADGDAETYLLPLELAGGERGQQVWDRAGGAVIARVDRDGEDAVLFDSLVEPLFSQALLGAIARRRRFRGRRGEIWATPTSALRRLRDSTGAELDATLSSAEQSNNSVVFGERLILKMYRRLEPGQNPELEIGRFLTEQGRFPNIAPVAGYLSYLRRGGEESTVGLLQGYVPNQGDAWKQALDFLEDFFRRRGEGAGDPQEFEEWATLMGRRTGEMHQALAGSSDSAAFRPEPTSMLDARSVYQSSRTLAGNVFQLLRRSLPDLPESTQRLARLALEAEPELLQRLRGVLDRPIAASRIRCHGDFHLGQVLFTGLDYVVVDFEGEPARPLAERRLKRWAYKDVAGMMRSYEYAAHAALNPTPTEAVGLSPSRAERRDHEGSAREWAEASSQAFLAGWREVSLGAPYLGANPEESRLLLDTMLIEKALYELRYELNNRPGWVQIPIRGLLRLAGLEGEPA